MLRRGLILLLVLTATLVVADDVTHLILKDGSYQAITKYEIQGDRVHYFSAERNQWEDVPKEMVDWDATKKYEQAHQAKSDSAEKNEEAQEAADRIDPKDAKNPAVAPNLRLPDGGGVIALDQYNGKPDLVRLTQSSSETDEHTGAYILLKTVDPLASKRTTIELPGPHAKLQLHTTHPVFYLNVDTDSDSDSATDRKYDQERPSSDAYLFQIVKLGENRKSRRLATTFNSGGEEDTDVAKAVPTIGQLTPGNIWVKVDPKQDLAPGEYAIVLALGEDRINSYVWDFGINPSAGPNPAAGNEKKPAANDADTAKRMKD